MTGDYTEWKALSEHHERKVRELESKAESYTRLSESLRASIDEETASWPASVKALDPGPDSPIEQRVAWRNQALALVAELTAAPVVHLPGNRPGPPPAGYASVQQAVVAANKDALKKDRFYF
jgi:hypothetical protein